MLTYNVGPAKLQLESQILHLKFYDLIRAHLVNIQIFQYYMVFYLENLEMNFIGTEAMKK